MWDRLLINCRIASMASSQGYGMIDDGAIGIQNERIAWVGGMKDIAADLGDAAREIDDLGGALVTPGLIDCHTHVVYGGNRAAEFEMRLNGATYEEIAKAGGGILSTVKATRAASEDELVESALPRIDAMIAEGVTTLEIKSGYGLDLDNELKMLRAAKRLGKKSGITVKTTLLAAHAVPSEYKDRPDDYIDYICSEIIPAARAENLADAVDGFCETIGFTPAQIERVFQCAREHDLPVKLHAEQLSDQGGAKLAARYGALSADHLEYLSESNIANLTESGTVAVMLPGAFYFLRDEKVPPIEAMRAAGVPMAVATDCNPGSSPMTSILLAMNMACTLFRMTPLEALAGVTVNAAKALGVDQTQGTIEKGKRADLAVWNIREPAELSYNIGLNPIKARYFAGTP